MHRIINSLKIKKYQLNSDDLNHRIIKLNDSLDNIILDLKQITNEK
jgi:hypothetical protein